MTSSGGLLARDDILSLLTDLNGEAAADGIRVELFLVGGAAMALAYDVSRTTDDLDGVFVPKARVYELAKRVAGRSSIAGIDPDWLNDAVKGFLPGEDSNSTVVLELSHLSVSVASPRYLFVMKALAAREVDEDDLKTLYPLCGFESVSAALDAIEQAYPLAPLKLTTQYLVEAVAAVAERPRQAEPNDR